MPEDVIAKIKERIDIVELISGYLKLIKAGVNYKARCPFHNEKTGSFFVSPERQIWHCFGCGVGGDCFGFIRQIEGVEFPEALRTLAAKAGVELQPYSRERQEFQTQKTRLYEVCELAAKFFEKQLWHSVSGQKTLMYLRERGVEDKTTKAFRLGFAPDNWNALTDFLLKKYTTQEIIAAGMAIKKDNGGYYDRFRSRIMFPVSDINGQVVGFSGRSAPDVASVLNMPGRNDTISAESDSKTTPKAEVAKRQDNVGLPAQTGTGAAKYINTPQTPIYDKSRILYGLDKAKLAVRQLNRCLVIEGNMDVIMSHQAGAAHVVASSGTAMTEGHLKIIKRYTDNLDLCFDADDAGWLATDRGVQLALAKGFNVGIVSINEPGIKDPADYVKKYGAKWAETALVSRPFMEVFFANAKQKFDLGTALGKKLLTQKLLPFLAAVANKIEQAHWVSELAVAMKVKEELLLNELVKQSTADIVTAELSQLSAKKNDLGTNNANINIGTADRLNLLEESILSLLIKMPELFERITPELEIYLSDRCRKLIKQINAVEHETEQSIIANLTSANEPSLKMSLDIIYLKAMELWKDFEEVEMMREFDRLLAQAKRHFVSAQLERLEFDIKSAEKNKDKVLLASLMTDFSKIAKELGN